MKAMCNCPNVYQIASTGHYDSCPVWAEQARARIAALEGELAAVKEMRVSIPLSHAAGFAAGARAFAEWMLNQGWVIDYGSAHGRENAGDACDEFLASQRETNSNNENKEGE